MKISSRRRVVFMYLRVTTAGNLLWEIFQLPLYTIWKQGSVASITFAVLHCTLGDFLIATGSLGLSLLIVGRSGWPQICGKYFCVACLTVFFGVAYTLFSELFNVELYSNWTYTAQMPRLPWLGTGLAPLTQWFVVPITGFLLAKRTYGR